MNELTQQNNLSTQQQKAWGNEGTSSKDLVIPRIKICQALSKAVAEGNARPGDIIHGQTNELLAAKGGKLELLPILCLGFWAVHKVIPGGQPEFMRQEPLLEENDSDNWLQDMFENNQPVQWRKTLSFLCLLVGNIKGFPIFVDFTKTNKNSGKILSTIMQENGFADKPGCSRVVELSTSTRTYKNNSWFVYGINPKRDASEEEMNACYKWYTIFQAKQMQTQLNVNDEDGGVL